MKTTRKGIKCMGLIAVTEVTKLLGDTQVNLTEADKEFVIQFAFRTSDNELTKKLINELCLPEKDSQAIYQKYQTVVDFQPEWITQIEDLLIALERYRIQEEKAIQTLTDILSAYDITITKLHALSASR